MAERRFAEEAIAAAPADLDVAAIVHAYDDVEIIPWRQVVPTFGCWMEDDLCVWSGPLERLREGHAPSRRLALHPDDVSKLHPRLAA